MHFHHMECSASDGLTGGCNPTVNQEYLYIDLEPIPHA